MTTKFDEACTAAAAKLIEAIEAGADGEWTMPWHSPNGFPIPTNALTGNPYRGGNWLLASVAGFANEWSSGCWATYKQWQALGRQIPKGASGIGLVRWVKPRRQDSNPTDGDNDDQPRRRIPFRFKVFAAEQLLPDDGAPWQPPAEQTTTLLDPEQRQPDLDEWMESTGANIVHGGRRAFYVGGQTDEIHLPGPDQWREWSNWGDYYATAGHELVHWTGHESRLDRPRIAGVDRTEEAQAFEELIAEFGSAMLGQHFGFVPSRRADHLGYLSHWAAQLRADPRTLWRAASNAQKAVAQLMSCSTDAPEEESHG